VHKVCKEYKVRLESKVLREHKALREPQVQPKAHKDPVLQYKAPQVDEVLLALRAETQVFKVYVRQFRAQQVHKARQEP
jgi:hypothetical protein